MSDFLPLDGVALPQLSTTWFGESMEIPNVSPGHTDVSPNSVETCTGADNQPCVVENVRSAIIDNNEIDGLAAYGVMVRGSANTLVRANRVHNTGYGLAFVLGDAKSPSTAVENIIIEPKFNGIDVIGDSPILRRNQVLRPHALPLHVDGFSPPGGQKVQAQPFLDNNTFDKGGWTPTAASPAATTPAGPAPAASAGDAKPQTSQ